MLAMEVLKNGVRVCVAGAQDLGVLTANFTAGGSLGPRAWDFSGKTTKPHMHLNVGGLTSRKGAQDDHLDWIGHMEIQTGDAVTLRFIEIDEADPPVESRPAEHKTLSSDEREYFKALEQQYIGMLKKLRKKQLATRSTRTRAKTARAGKRRR
ncbi:MAG TPA: hypothetical protein VGR01_09595 [Burkholderiales bacterium]|jgi:hypothetical protein|nr:hypothetical protein [Burkholderiales bacterium]